MHAIASVITRVRDHFQGQMHIPVSAGSVFNFNKEAYERLASFEQWAKTRLARSDLLHADETGINIGGKRHWLHCASNASLTWFYPHVLRFMEVESIPFTNNQGENDLRMTKVQQKISGCFRSMEGAKIFCRVRSYLSTCRKQGMTATHALTLLFQGKDPDFMKMDEVKDG